MACHGLKAYDVVELVIEIIILPEVDVGTPATVLAVDEEEHTIDVDFGGERGIVRGLDAHSFAKLKDGPKDKTRSHTAPLSQEEHNVQAEEEEESIEEQMAKAKLKKRELVARS